MTPIADTLNSALNSFYSEMATITSTSAATSDVAPSEDSNKKIGENAIDKVKKKKKTKVVI